MRSTTSNASPQMIHSIPAFTSPTTSFLFFARRTISTAAAMQTNPSRPATAAVQQVPALNAEEMGTVADQTFHRYTTPSSSPPKVRGRGVAIVWFRNDLRILDNEALLEAWASSQAVLPVYCVDPRTFSGTTRYFGFPKTGALRTQFLKESLVDLKRNLTKYGLDLLIKQGKPEDLLPSLAKAYAAHTVYAQKETCSEEVNIEKSVARNLELVPLTASEGLSTSSNSTSGARLKLVWGGSMYHIDDLPFDCKFLPDVYTQFRKSVESKSEVRNSVKLPSALGPPPPVVDWGCISEISQFVIETPKVNRGMRFVGGESAGLSRIHEYFWKKDLLAIYKETRNGMLGSDYSTKFSPWLASGCLSARLIYEEVKRYEAERQSNNSTYWLVFELIWRDYFRFLSIKQGNSLFYLGGSRKVEKNWSVDCSLFDAWAEGRSGYPLIDANMKELSTTGFMSNRGRQIVCSFLVRDMGIDWRMGAEWFESYLLDYDPCSNYGNWTYGAGVGNDPREDRYFSIPKQAQNYDREGEYVAYWLPELQSLPREKRNFPGRSYIKPVVALKFGSINNGSGQTATPAPRRGRGANKWNGDGTVG